jgi:hypothetical protein
MPEEMVENWEADDAAENWEADDAYGEAEDSAEDIGERARRRPQRPVTRFRGVKGIVVPGPDGRPRKLPFRENLATAADTNKGLASVDARRRALAERLDRLEARNLGNMKKDAAITGAVTLGIGGGLTAYGIFKTAGQDTGFQLHDWANRESTQIAAVVSATQLATSGAKLLINGRYHRSGIGIAADIFSALQIATFAFGSLPSKPSMGIVPVVTDTTNPGAFANGSLVWDKSTKELMEVIETSSEGKFFVPISSRR